MRLVKLAIGNIYGMIVMALLMVVVGTVALMSIPVDVVKALDEVNVIATPGTAYFGDRLNGDRESE